MKNLFVTVLFSLLFIGCKQKLDSKDIPKLNGYWEIEQAIMPDGENKDYKVNATVDYFNFKDEAGYRKKVMPQLDGKYLMNDVSENVKVVFENGDAYLNYSTPYAKWKEEIIELSDEKLVVKNEQDIEYHYKRYQPFSVK